MSSNPYDSTQGTQEVDTGVFITQLILASVGFFFFSLAIAASYLIIVTSTLISSVFKGATLVVVSLISTIVAKWIYSVYAGPAIDVFVSARDAEFQGPRERGFSHMLLVYFVLLITGILIWMGGSWYFAEQMLYPDRILVRIILSPTIPVLERLTSISLYLVYTSGAVLTFATISGLLFETGKFILNREKCPNCGNPVERDRENYCSGCKYPLDYSFGDTE